jgi:hypothetical protein
VTDPEFILNRRHLVLGLAATALGCTTVKPQARPRQVLFVCEHGSVKSPIAREHFRRIAARRGLAVRALSRGIHPSDDVSPKLAQALVADGIDPRCDPLTALTRADLADADIIAAFNPIPDALTTGLLLDLRYWLDVPAMNDDYAAARPPLLAHLDALAGELERG